MDMQSLRTPLKAIIADDRLHARFLNSFSYLEYRGARKMARALESEDIDDDVLAHAMEEARHALYLKKMAMKIGGTEFKYYRPQTLLSESAIKRYIHELDSTAGAVILQAHEPRHARKAVYHFVTWLLEVRAIALYEIYEELLRSVASPVSLRPILADEENHLTYVTGHVETLRQRYGIEAAPLVELEERLFWQSWNELQQAATEAPATTSPQLHA